MKKLKYLILILLLIPFSAYAETINCSAPGSVESGQTFNVTFSGSLTNETATWSAKIGSEGNATFVSGDLNIGVWGSASMSQTVTFKAGNPGTANFYIYDMDVAETRSDGPHQFYDSGRCTVTITEASKPSGSSPSSYSNNTISNDPDKSSNSYLKSISIDKVKLNPEFNKDNLEYKAVVAGDVEKITINAEAEDDKSTVDGLGEKELTEGVNRFEIRVHAENGEEKVYVLEITRKEKNPIEVIINKKKYTVFKKESNVEPPEGFVKTSIVIDKQEVVAYSNEYIDYILVLLVDEEGNSDFFIYNAKNSTYIKYTEVKSKDLRLVFIKAKKVPTSYRKTKLKLNNEEIEAYYIKGNNDFKLVYAINMNNGEEGFYQYDVKEKTFQRYNSKLVSSVEGFSKKLEIGLVAAAALVIILIIIIISLASSKSKIKKAIKNKKENEAINRIVNKEEKKEEVKEEPKLSRKELKRLKKEEKKKLKEAQDDFLS